MVLRAVPVVAVLLVAGAGCVEPQGGTGDGTMTFLVDVPENTPPGDTVWIFVGHEGHEMERVGERTFRAVVEDPGTGDVRYRYVRNGYSFHTAEYLAPTAAEPDRDTNDFFWTKLGRRTDFEPGAVQRDEVERWRWFPDGPLPDPATDIEPRGTFLPRASGGAFRSGQTIEDLYVPAYEDFIESTAARLVAQGYTWVELDPPWQWSEVDGLPRVVNDVQDSPNYPDDEAFLRELRAYTDVGLHAMVAPQLCCTGLDTRDRSEAWWDAYFSETERFLSHFAALAQQGDASAFAYAVSAPSTAEPDNAGRWGHVFAAVREHFDGEVGQMVWLLGPEVSPQPQTIPSPQEIPWGGELDFFLVHSDFPLSTLDDPTDEELLRGARAVADGTRGLHDAFGKPVLLRNGYFNVQHAWKGQSYYQIDSVPAISEPEAAVAESGYVFDAHDHARTVDAQFRAIAERPWIEGYLHFGYTHWEDPLSPWMSVRGKEAEEVWRKWNEVAHADPSPP